MIGSVLYNGPSWHLLPGAEGVRFPYSPPNGDSMNNNEEDLVYRLRKRAEIRRQIPTRKSVQENAPDRIADLLEEAANEIEKLRTKG